MRNQEDVLKILNYYASHGWPIFPVYWLNGDECACGKKCKSPGKHPLIERGFYSATTNIATIRGWHERWPEANWGMRTGDTSQGGAGILVVDIDRKSGGFETWDQLRLVNPEPIETIAVSTPNDGQHNWFEYPTGHVIKSGAGVLGPGVDIRANNGYVLVPPSQLKKTYKFEINPNDAAISPLPGWILAVLDGRAKEEEKATPAARVAKGVKQGERHGILVELAGGLRRTGFDEEMITRVLKTTRDEKFATGDHPVEDVEIEEIVKWILSKTQEYHFTDLGNKDRFLARHSQDVRYCYETEKWMVWDGQRWCPNNLADLISRGHETVQAIYTEAANCTDVDHRKNIARHAIHSEARAKIDNMLYCAQPYVAIKPDELDAQPMLLNVRNGIINLATGELIPHERGYYLSKFVDVEYHPKAECPKWLAFMDLITAGDQEEEYFLQKAVGYSLTGRTDEHCLFFLLGSGANGKTTFTELLRRLFGEYSTRVDIEAFMSNWNLGTAATPYVAGLAGARFALASETEENRKWNEALIKEITGGDALTARFLHTNPVTFKPVHKLWVYGNHEPKVTGTDLGFWRRMRVVPFEVTIPEEIRRPMAEVIQEFEGELQGILAWAVLGCLLWQSDGLPLTGAVKDATMKYRTEQDLVQQFIDEKCKLHPNFTVSKDVLYTRWCNWLEENGEDAAMLHRKRWFVQKVISRGFKPCGDGRKKLAGIE